MSNNLNSRLKKIAGEFDKMDSISSMPDAKIGLQKKSKLKSKRSEKILINSPNLMIPEEESLRAF
jgi:hypothetical protein